MPEIDSIVIQLMNSVSLMAILALISVGLAIIFGMMGVINLAHGEFFMLGAYTVVAVQLLVPNFWLGVVLAPIAVGLVGLVMEVSVVKRLYTRPLETLLATWGFSIVLRQVVRIVMGPGFRQMPAPFGGQVSIFGIPYSSYRIFIIGVTVVVMLAVAYWLLRTGFGTQVRAVISNRQMAAAIGINTANADRFVFALGAGLAGLAGAIMAPLVTINPEMGIPFLARSFLVVVVGGLGSLWGVVGGGAIIGGGEGLVSFFTSAVVAQVVVLLLAILVIRIRPEGLIRR
ncbi:MAG: urea ABC transporter permease subunit UrtB [Chloroflexota bacterium]